MKPETQCLHAGTTPDPPTNSRAIPVHRTSFYGFNDTEHSASLFALRELSNIDPRLMNPAYDLLEQRIAVLEGGLAGLAHASGTAAVFNSINTICRAGDEPERFSARMQSAQVTGFGTSSGTARNERVHPVCSGWEH